MTAKSPPFDPDPDPPTHLLPQKLREIAEFCGVDVATKLLERYAGQLLFVPEAAKPGHHLTENLGIEFAAKLCEHFGSSTFHVPKATALMIHRRHLAVLRSIQAGRTTNEVARETGLTQRHVLKILSRHRVASNTSQLDWLES